MSGIQTSSEVLKRHQISTGVRKIQKDESVDKWSSIKKVKVYPKDVSLGEVVDLNTYLKYLDRARVDLGEKIFSVNENSSLFTDNNIQVYSIQLQMHSSTSTGEKIKIKSKSYKKSDLIGLVEQKVINMTSGKLVLDANIELILLNKEKQLTTFVGVDLPPLNKEPLFNNTDIKPPLKQKTYYNYKHSEKIYTEDTDLLGITFHASYLRFIESTIFEYLEENNKEFGSWKYWKYNKFYVRFFNSTTAGDNLEIVMGTRKTENSRLIVNQKIIRKNDNAIIIEGNYELDFIK